MHRHFARLALALPFLALPFLATPALAQGYETDFADLGAWLVSDGGTSQWAADALPATHCAGAFRSPPASLNFNDDTDAAAASGGSALSPPIDLSLLQDPVLEFWVSWEHPTGGCDPDALRLFVIRNQNGTVPVQVCLSTPTASQCAWSRVAVDLDPSWGVVTLQFFATSSGGTSGAFVDDLVVRERLELTCSPAFLNSQATPVTLANSSFAPGSTTDLHLEATGGPPNEFGFVLVAAETAAPVFVFGGLLCLPTPIGRYDANVAANQGVPELDSIGQFDAGGTFVSLLGFSSQPTGYDVPLALPFTPAGQTIAPGDTWHFQVWYRDVDVTGAPSANFSDVLRATFH